MSKLIIEVKGGVVQHVYSNNKNITVEILDLDDIGRRKITPEEKRLVDETKYMKQIF